MKRDTRESILAKIGIIYLELKQQKRHLPCDFEADDELEILASGRIIRDSVVAETIQSFIDRSIAVRERLVFFQRLHRLECRLVSFDKSGVAD